MLQMFMLLSGCARTKHYSYYLFILYYLLFILFIGYSHSLFISYSHSFVLINSMYLLGAATLFEYI